MNIEKKNLEGKRDGRNISLLALAGINGIYRYARAVDNRGYADIPQRG